MYILVLFFSNIIYKSINLKYKVLNTFSTRFKKLDILRSLKNSLISNLEILLKDKL